MKPIIDWMWQRLPASAAWIWQALARCVAALWASLVAMIRSPAVWLACGVVFVGGFSLGHLNRSVVVRAVKHDLTTAVQSRDAAVARERSIAASLAKARQEAADAKAELEALKTPRLVKSRPAAKPSPRKRPQTAKPTPAPSFFNPFAR